MKIGYLMRSVAHFTYHESTLKALVKSGHQIQILLDPFWSRNRSTKYVDDWIRENKQNSVILVPLRTDFWRKIIFPLRELRSYSAYLRRTDQSQFYLKRWSTYLSEYWRKKINGKYGPQIVSVLKTKPAFVFLTLIEKVVPPDKAIVKFLKEQSLDILVASPLNMRFSEEVEYIKAAKSIGLKTVLPVLSWDNLSTKGLIHVIPDQILAWNEAHKEEAIRIHSVPEKQIKISGSPFFDKWFCRPLVASGQVENFQQMIGMAVGKPFITYLGSSKNIATDESWLVNEIAEEFDRTPDLSDLQIIVRPHPANADIYTKLKHPRIIMWPRPPFSFEMGVPEDEDSLREFQLTLDSCVATIGLNTSAMLESVIRDRPTISFFADRYKSTQTEAVHFQHLLKSGALNVVRTLSELKELVRSIRNGVDHAASERKKFTREFIRPCGSEKLSGEMQAEFIESVML